MWQVLVCSGTGQRCKRSITLGYMVKMVKWYSSSWKTHFSQSYGASPAVWDHTVICHPTQVNVPHAEPNYWQIKPVFDPRGIDS